MLVLPVLTRSTELAAEIGGLVEGIRPAMVVWSDHTTNLIRPEMNTGIRIVGEDILGGQFRHVDCDVREWMRGARFGWLALQDTPSIFTVMATLQMGCSLVGRPDVVGEVVRGEVERLALALLTG